MERHTLNRLLLSPIQPSVTRILDNKRSQSVGIIMKNLKVDGKYLDAEAIKQALCSGDTEVLKAEIVSRLDEMVSFHFLLVLEEFGCFLNLLSFRKQHQMN